MSTQARSMLAKAREALESPVDYQTFLSKFGSKDRLNIERHMAACQSESGTGHAELWRRLACDLMTLAPHMPKTGGQQTIQFYIPDGKYRMQVFALADMRDGTLVVYAGNSLQEAIDAGVLSGPRRGDEGDGMHYRIGKSNDSLMIEQLDGQSPNPAPYYKDMLGWNRKGIRITLPIPASPEQVEAVEALCALSARKWFTSKETVKP